MTSSPRPPTRVSAPFPPFRLSSPLPPPMRVGLRSVKDPLDSSILTVSSPLPVATSIEPNESRANEKSAEPSSSTST
jgi:hypothetical protein